MTRNGVIGRDGQLPWDLPADRRLFRRLTEGNTVIMGRRTFESLQAPLPNRHNIIINRTLNRVSGAMVCRGFLESVAQGWRLGRPVYVIGGVELYRKALMIADTLHISWIVEDAPGDRYFPPRDPADWIVVNVNDYPGFQHITYRRRLPLFP
jgi:dihydrofolate reductase